MIDLMSPVRRTVRTIAPLRVVASCIWLGLAMMGIIMLANAQVQDQREVVFYCSLIDVAFGVGVFIWHGADRVSVLGIFSLASAMFIGVAGAYAALIEDDRVPMLYLGQAVIAGLLLHVIVWIVAGPAMRPGPLSLLRPENASWATRWGIGVLLVLVIMEALRLFPALSGFIEGAAVAATVVLTIGILWRPEARILSFGTLVPVSAFVVYATVFHSGAGRLRIITLACALLLLYGVRFRRAAIKWLVICCTPIALVVLAQQRLSLQESLQVGASAGRNGLESMLVPIVVYGQLLREQAEGRALGWGGTLLSFPLSVLPDDIAPSAANAFGYEMVRIYSPERYGTGYSTAATVGAEGVFNFGLLGILILVPLVAWLLVTLDRRIILAASSIGVKKTSIVALAFWATFGGAVADLAWSGQHTFLARTVTRVPLLLVLLVNAIIDGEARGGKIRRQASAAEKAKSFSNGTRPVEPSGLLRSR